MIHPLAEVLVLCATPGGAGDLVEVARWGRSRLEFPRRLLPYARGAPSHDTLCDVVSALDPELFEAAFAAWVESLREAEPDIVAIDGKTSRRSHDRARVALRCTWCRPGPAGHGPEDMAIVRHTAINLLNRTESLKTRRKRAGCDDDDLQAVIPQTACAASSDCPAGAGLGRAAPATPPDVMPQNHEVLEFPSRAGHTGASREIVGWREGRVGDARRFGRVHGNFSP